MMDEFEAKHDLIQKLLSMLKSSAVNEVEGGLHPPIPEGIPKDAKGMEIEKVSMIPGEEGKETSESPEAESLADEVMGHGHDEPEPMGETDVPEHEDAEEMPAFSMLMKKKLGKK